MYVWWNLHNNAKKDRTYSDLSVGDKVRVMLKKTTFRKQTDKRWSDKVYEITFKKDGYYLINDPDRKKKLI